MRQSFGGISHTAAADPVGADIPSTSTLHCLVPHVSASTIDSSTSTAVQALPATIDRNLEIEEVVPLQLGVHEVHADLCHQEHKGCRIVDNTQPKQLVLTTYRDRRQNRSEVDESQLYHTAAAHPNLG